MVGGVGTMQTVWVAILLALQDSYGLGIEAVKKPFGPRLGQGINRTKAQRGIRTFIIIIRMNTEQTIQNNKTTR
jgi:hypothetical protein